MYDSGDCRAEASWFPLINKAEGCVLVSQVCKCGDAMIVTARSCADEGNVHTFCKFDSMSVGRSLMSKSRRARACSVVYKRSPNAISEQNSHPALRDTYLSMPEPLGSLYI